MNSISQKYSLEFNNCIKNKIFNSINEIGEKDQYKIIGKVSKTNITKLFVKMGESE